MRITNNMMVNNMMGNVNKNLFNQSKIYDQINSTKKFQRPSDDPIGVARSLKITSDISENDQFKKNVEDAYSFLDKTETSLKELNNVLKRIRDLSVDAANGTKTPDDTKKIKSEVEQLKDQIIKISNDTYVGRRIFNGYKTDKDVLEADGSIKDTGNYPNLNPMDPLDPTKFNPNYQKIEYQIGISNKVQVNVTAQQVFGDGVEVKDSSGNQILDANGNPIKKPKLIDDVEKMIKNLESGDSEAISKDLDVIDKHVENLLQLRADIGAKTNTVETVKERIEDTKLNFTKLLSETEDTDMPEAYMQMKIYESVYQASLSVGAKIIQPTLVDFLR